MPFRIRRVAVVLVTLLAAPATAQEDRLVPDATLQGLVEEALARNPQLAASRHLEAAARTQPVQAGSRPGPTLGVFYENDGIAPSLGREPMTLLGVTAGQEIPYPGKLSGRRAVAEAEAGLAALDVERTRLSLISSVKRAYYGLVMARGLAALALEHRDVWREVQETARVRYASAVGSQPELLRAQIEATRLQALHAQHHAEARARLAQLNALLARPVDTPVETPVSITPRSESRSAAELVEWSSAHSPEIQAASLAVQRQERAFALAKLGSKPDLMVQGGYMNRGSLPPMWQVGASVALPSKARARAALAEAEARLAASKARLDDVRVRLSAAVEQRLALIEATETIAVTYREGLLLQGDIAVQSALARYGAGQGSQMAVFDAAAALIEDRTDHLRLLVSRETERARLEEASLEPPMGIDSPLMHGRGAGGGGIGAPAEGAPAAPGASPTTAAGMGR